jgi:hypothetical protein
MGWWWLVIAALALAAAYNFGLNRNLLYGSMLFAGYALLVLARPPSWIAASGLVATLYLGLVPVAIPASPFIDVAPEASVEHLLELPPGATWNFRFILRGLPETHPELSRSGLLYINGRDLAGLKILINAHQLDPKPWIKQVYRTDHLALPIAAANVSTLTVTLQAEPGHQPRIFTGGEVRGRQIYPDAVWLEFSDKRSALLYHARRTTVLADLATQ